jgi:signal transduction histidine kinase
MTAATRRISEENLDRRLALPGARDELTKLADTIDGLLERLEGAGPGAIAIRGQRLARTAPPARDDAGLAGCCDGQAGCSSRTRPRAGRIASDALARHAPEISAKQLDVDLQTAAGVWVTGSETLLLRMAENVIENAICHNEPGGWVRVALVTDGSSVTLVVENGGMPLTQDDVDRLAEPFRRLGAARTGSQAGAGLGLSIVASIAQAHGGALHLRARTEGGLRVVIALPSAADVEVGARR